MRCWKYIASLVFVLLTVSAVAQTDKVADALFQLKNNNLDRARGLIDTAGLDTFQVKTSRLWYVRGYIYKDLYKQKRDGDSAQFFRLEALSAFRKTIELDEEKEYLDNVTKIMRFLASTLYNDAATALDNMDYDKAVSYYGMYKDIISQTDPGYDFTNRDIQFKLVLASVFNKLYEDSFITAGGDTALEGNEDYFNQVKNLYEQILAVDSNNVSANYNLGILFYNQAVQIIEHMNVTADLVELFEIQERCIVLFKESLPYMQRAYALNPTRKETLISLSGIYFSLNDLEKSEAFKKELKDIEDAEKEQDSPTPLPEGPNAPDLEAPDNENEPTPQPEPKQD